MWMHRVVAAIAGLVLVGGAARAADPPSVAGSGGMVVTAQHLATEVGVSILRRGGNAVDAAVAVGYALAVVYPQAGNIGGGGFMTLRLKDGRTTFLDFREKAPLAATATMFQDANGHVVPGRSTDSWLAIGVPGTVLGLETARARYGSLPREVLMAPAIQLARRGYVLEAGDVRVFRLEREGLAGDPAASGIFLPGGRAPEVGERLVQTDLAGTLELISREGPAAVYGGPIGREIADAVRAGGGVMSPQDFVSYRVRELRPVECDYRGYHVISAPPPSSGGVALCESLMVLSGYDLAGMGFHSAAEVHVLTETLRRVYFDRNNTLGDPDFVRNPISRLLDPAYAARLRSEIDPVRATPSSALGPGPNGREGSNTTQYDVLDSAGDAVSVTYTLNDWFGSHRVAGRTGILLNNEMDDFTSKPGVPNMFGLVEGANNAVAPGKTPLSSMTPTIVVRGNRTLILGSPGGSRIISITLEALLNLVDHGMNLQEAIDAPRVHHQWLPDEIEVEPFALSPDTRRILEASGYRIHDENRYWGIAEGIITLAPSLASGPQASGALRLEDASDETAPMYGAHDVRGGSGLALAVR